MKGRLNSFQEPGSSPGSKRRFFFGAAVAVLAPITAFLAFTSPEMTPRLIDAQRTSKKARPINRIPNESLLAGPTSERPASFVQTTSDPREDAFRIALESVAAAEIPETLQALQATEQDPLLRELSLRLVRTWAQNDPPVAAKWAQQQTAGPLRAGALEQVALAWANSHAEAAAQWARQLPETERPNALGCIAQEVVRTDPVKALQLASELPSGEMRENLLTHAVAEWATTDANKAIAWARQIPDKSLREQLVAAAATSWSDRDPTAAATLAVTDLSGGRIQADTVVSIVQRWSQQNREQAAAWVQSFPQSELRQTAIENLDPVSNRSL